MRPEKAEQTVAEGEIASKSKAITVKKPIPQPKSNSKSVEARPAEKVDPAPEKELDEQDEENTTVEKVEKKARVAGPRRRNIKKSDLALQLQGPATHPRPPRSVFVFGCGDLGQFGLGVEKLIEIHRPRPHAWFDKASEDGILGEVGAGLEKICAGGLHTLAIDENGHVWSFGVNDNGALGRHTSKVADPANPGGILRSDELESNPMILQTLLDENFRAVHIAAGDSISIAIGDTGEIRAWGSFRSSDGPLGFTGLSKAEQNQIHPIPIHEFMYLRFVDAVCGNDHVVALTREGEIYCFGDGEQGQLGRKLLQRRKGAGLQPEGLHMTKFVVIGSGAYHSFGVHEDGGVYAWGLNSCNQTGVSSSSKNKQEVLFRPEEVVALSPEALGGGRRVVSISGGEHHSLFLLSDGSVWGCGRCDGAELGLPKDHPAMADIIAKRTKKGDINRAINGEYLAAPAPLIFPPPPSAGDLAPALPAYATLSDPYSTAPLDPITWISAGTRHNLAVSRSGSVYSWGYGNTYQLGLGVGVDAAEAPTRVRSLKMNDFHVESAAAGGQHCLLLARKIVVEAENVGANA